MEVSFYFLLLLHRLCRDWNIFEARESEAFHGRNERFGSEPWQRHVHCTTYTFLPSSFFHSHFLQSAFHFDQMVWYVPFKMGTYRKLVKSLTKNEVSRVKIPLRSDLSA